MRVIDSQGRLKQINNAATLTINTTAPLTGGATLSPNGSLTLAASVFVASGGSHATGIVPDPGSTAGTYRFLREDASWAGPSAVVGQMMNLLVQNNSGTPNTKIDFTGGNQGSFFEVSLSDTSTPTQFFRARSTSTVTCDTGTTGANGLDTGVLAASTCYYLWLIWNPSTATLASLISTSSSAPTMPSGYTFKALVGALFTDGSVHFQTYRQMDRLAWVTPQVALNNGAASLANTYQSLSLSTIVPSIADAVTGHCGSSLSGNGCAIAIAGDANGTGEQCFFDPASNTSAFNSYFVAGVFGPIPMLTASTLYWKSLTTGAQNRIVITGWRY